MTNEERLIKIENSITDEYNEKIWKRFLKGIEEYNLIQNGDKIAVCISGGKDSMILAKCMQLLAKKNIYNFEAEFLVMDPGYNPKNREMIENNAKILNVPIKIFQSNIFEVVDSVIESPCYLCARMRRGHLYKNAKDLGCNKIALGHHFDDVIETIMMGMLFNGQIQSMMPKLHSSNFDGMELIRPLYKVKEKDIISWKNYNGLNFIQCACRLTESIHNEKNLSSKRQEMKILIKELTQSNSETDNNIFNSMYDIDLNEIIGFKKNGKKN
jgi:tRNA(Ile)-lysidine synthase TilS/MesJ